MALGQLDPLDLARPIRTRYSPQAWGTESFRPRSTGRVVMRQGLGQALPLDPHPDHSAPNSTLANRGSLTA